ncbi:MFS transporter [Geomonas sp.]|uniref:MFS transporter n=1 Tax=Geomonas sp. TaxID=2651584 RepID=UPI002B47042E|nr:MFS transporter [Geomonas sp.]HJV36240.1 MFS transporter [Geomonas sp.]
MSLLPQVLRSLPHDGWLLFIARSARMFAYGFLAVVLALYLDRIGISAKGIGLLLTLTLVGDTAISLWLTTVADRFGRKKMLVVGAGLMLLAGGVFAATTNYPLLVLAATVGVISPSGNEVGPFLPIEQASLTQLVGNKERTGVFAWYSLAGSVASAVGAIFGGGLAQGLINAGWSPVASYRLLLVVYAGVGALLWVLFRRLTPAAESPRDESAPAAAPSFLAARLGLHRSFHLVLKMSGLFALDAFGGGFIPQSIMAYWFYLRFGVEPGLLGSIFFVANLLAAVSALAAARVAARIGLIRTMVFTHLPSNILLILVPLMPNLPLAIAVLLLRFSISQMDVPTRQSYTMAVVSPDELSAAAGITGVARTTGAAISPIFTGIFLANAALWNVPFFLAGGLKIIYDLSLYRSLQAVKPPEE